MSLLRKVKKDARITFKKVVFESVTGRFFAFQVRRKEDGLYIGSVVQLYNTPWLFNSEGQGVRYEELVEITEFIRVISSIG